MTTIKVACCICFIFCASWSNADEIFVKKEKTLNGTHYSFSNTNVNVHKYDDGLSFRGMTTQERAQADRIENENNRTRAGEIASRQQREAKIEREIQMKAQAEQRIKEERAKAKPIIVNVW